jgi:uncharacterized Zn-binding protein involved in type VI secretion
MEINTQFLKHLTNKGQKFFSLALVKKIIVESDEVLLEVELVPTGETPLVRMSWDYEGKGFGLYVLPEVDDEIFCLFPNGDLNSGICIKRLNNGIDTIPNGVGPNKILLVTKSGHNIEIIIPEGNINLTMTGTANVNITGNVNLSITGDVSADITGNLNISSGGPATIDAPSITLAGGGSAVARQGDPVEVSCPLHGSHTGTIISGSSKVNSG